MKKRILLLSSSPRRHGNSDRLCDEFLRGAREAGHDAEKISLRDCRIGYCTGCGVCYDTRTCPQRDDAAQIVGKMIAADVIVLATPVYFYTMSAQMKTLIDRCCARYIIRKSKCSTDFKRNDFLKKTKRTHWVRFVHLNSLIESCVFLYLWNSPFDTFL